MEWDDKVTLLELLEAHRQGDASATALLAERAVQLAALVEQQEEQLRTLEWVRAYLMPDPEDRLWLAKDGTWWKREDDEGAMQFKRATAPKKFMAKLRLRVYSALRG